ncbi:hypothetical protein MACH09_37410 [Vibrio sp. MACH09]|uniref:hypothetical protein n=1 Tax=Vibrio sp. MACH09 TaxID=3025122 RepID=UPI002793F3C0|nr:hypothetical protein [Vibrio sp. MACH09]GLO63233.1 hypothetical protein MACH09_37410 [Vibrio sp. MACH09]
MKSYESIECRTKKEAELALQQNSNISRDELVTLLLSLYEIEDVKWVQEQYQKYISGNNGDSHLNKQLYEIVTVSVS